MRTTSLARLAELDTSLQTARQRLGDELRRLSLSPPCLVLHEVEPGLSLLSARIPAMDQSVMLHLPVTVDEQLPAELAARIELPAPATALLGREGWQPHPDQADDPFARAFCDRLREAHVLQGGLSWAPAPDGGQDWLVQIVADSAESCLLAVRTGPVGPRQDQLGLSVFMDLLPRVRHLLRSWERPYALPMGAARDCLALHDQPAGESWDPDWRQEEGFVLVPEPLLEEEDDDTPTELDDYRPLVNLAELALVEREDEDEEGELLDEPVLEIIDPEDCEEEDGDDPTVAEATPPWVIEEEEEAVEHAAVALQEPPAEIADPSPQPAVLPAPQPAALPAPGLAAIASLFLPGLGQILCGERRRGGLILLASVLTLGLGGLLNLYAAWDAWKIARR